VDHLVVTQRRDYWGIEMDNTDDQNIPPSELAYLKTLEDSLREWDSFEDQVAYCDL